MVSSPIDVALVDVRMPDSDGLELLHDMKARWPEVPVIMLTSFDHAHYVRRALAEGAAGYMLKDATPEDLEQAIKVALSGGGNVLSPQVIQNLFEAMDGAPGSDNGEAAAPSGERAHPARDRHPRAARRGQEQPRHLAGAVPVGEDRQGAPRGDLPQARRQQPDAGRDGRRLDGHRTDGGGPRKRRRPVRREGDAVTNRDGTERSGRPGAHRRSDRRVDWTARPRGG